MPNTTYVLVDKKFNHFVAECSDIDSANFIVTACNSHEELLANIDAALYALETNRGDLSKNQRQALDNLLAVANKARGVA